MKYRTPIAILIDKNLVDLLQAVKEFIEVKEITDTISYIKINQDWAYDWVAQILMEKTDGV